MNPWEIFWKFFAIFIWVLLVALIIKLIIKTVKNNKWIYKWYYEAKQDVSSRADNNYTYKWRLLVKNEKIFYNLLKEVLQKEYWDRYEINCQVRMMDLFEMKRKDQWVINLSLDYLIVDKLNDFKPVMAIELDWESHDDPHQQKLDETKEELLSITDIFLVRIRNEDNLDKNIIYKLIIPNLAPTKWTSIFSQIFWWLFEKKEEIQIPDISNYWQSQNTLVEDGNKTVPELNYIKNENIYNWSTIRYEKKNYSNFKFGLVIWLWLIFFFIFFTILSSNIKSSNENKITLQVNNQNRIAQNTVQQKKIEEPITVKDHIDIEIKKEDNPCQTFIDEDKNNKQTSDKYTCTSNIFHSDYLNICVKNEVCTYTDNEKRYYIHNLSEWEYIFSCLEESNGNRKNYKISNSDIRDIVWPWEKWCNSLYAEIYRDLHRVNPDLYYN